MKTALYLAAILVFLGSETAESRGLYKVGATPPVLQRFVAPSYPKQAAAAHLGGSVVLWVVVEADGSVSDAKVQQPAGMDLDEAAARAVRKWSFLPALRDGKPVAVVILIPLSFDAVIVVALLAGAAAFLWSRWAHRIRTA